MKGEALGTLFAPRQVRQQVDIVLLQQRQALLKITRDAFQLPLLFQGHCRKQLTQHTTQLPLVIGEQLRRVVIHPDTQRLRSG